MHDRVQVAHCPGRQSPSLAVARPAFVWYSEMPPSPACRRRGFVTCFPRSVVGSRVGGLCVSIAGRAPGRLWSTAAHRLRVAGPRRHSKGSCYPSRSLPCTARRRGAVGPPRPLGGGARVALAKFERQQQRRYRGPTRREISQSEAVLRELSWSSVHVGWLREKPFLTSECVGPSVERIAE
jgi:hypothetical protein